MPAYSPKRGNKCSCRRGQERDNCPRCEGSGLEIDFSLIRNGVVGIPSYQLRGADKHGNDTGELFVTESLEMFLAGGWWKLSWSIDKSIF